MIAEEVSSSSSISGEVVFRGGGGGRLVLGNKEASPSQLPIVWGNNYSSDGSKIRGVEIYALDHSLGKIGKAVG